jgi:hypothetical protein
MDKDQRNRQQPIPDNLEQLLNSRQQAALKMIQSLGWRLKFVRRPMFMEAQPVVFNAKLDQVGILDTDGNINLQLELDVRSSEPEQDPQPTECISLEEKRKGMTAVPGNLDRLLNELQLLALKHIESFGWTLHFVRRQLFQEPVPGIISPEGDKIATLEQDGRINLLPDSAVRTEDKVKPAQQTEATNPAPQSTKKLF